ncbi:unnamed protein product [Heligmosomoides polygyrus]|uniref:Tudor domain-containing protein n=1 Tax=Heligmosomoides polygyrus TaxID=6339 RepID=A0A183FUJ9_HELPZ|nr:unnamed protein product [Heligmosomoides polygyrus]
MEDLELFPKDPLLNTKPHGVPVDMNCFIQMQSSLDRLWWSRLVISVRGYVVNYVQNDDEILFHTDDAFISIHRFLAEEASDAKLAQQVVKDAATKWCLVIKMCSIGRLFPNLLLPPIMERM